MKIKGHLDLFSGIGGFSLGLKNAGVEPEWTGFSDIDKYANATYKRRFPNAEQLGSIENVSYKTLRGRQIDLLTGGFPCQAFSIAGKRQGFKDTRGTLFFEIQRLLQDYINNKSPISCILLENVKGLLNHDNNRTFATIYKILSNLNYTIECQLVNTKWVLPQNRERIYIFGRYNGNPSGRKVFPIRANGKEMQKKLNQIGTIGKDSEATRVYDTSCARTIKNGGGMGAKTGLYDVTTHSLHPRSGNPKKGGTGHLKKEDGTAYCLDTGNAQAIEIKNPLKGKTNYGWHFEQNVYDKNGISRSLKASEGSGNKPKVFENNSRIRRLTPIECERLQGFPDNWTEGQSDTQRYKQCGNAVTVPIVEMIMRNIYEHRH